MIRVLLRGRSGNNFFQYAVGRYLALKHGVPLVLDGSWQRNGDWAQAQDLQRLNLKAGFARPFTLPSKICRKFFDKHPRQWTNAESFHELADDLTFCPEVLELGPQAFLSGYFQTPLYFPGLREVLQQEINFRELPMDDETAGIVNEIQAPGSVSLHIRRGDYLTYTDMQVCTPAYHAAAMRRMEQEVADPVFWIFSDDIPWCREHLKGLPVRFVDLAASAKDPFNDLRVMSHASHHIIMNSTYSWWAAWLYWQPGKQVILPDRWSTDAMTIPISEKTEPGWICLPGGGI